MCYMANSPEYRTLVHLRSELVFALMDNLLQLTSELFAVGIISKDTVDSMRNVYNSTTNRAFRLTEYISNKVYQDPCNYHKFTDVLRKQSLYHAEILILLDKTYETLKSESTDQRSEWVVHSAKSTMADQKSKYPRQERPDSDLKQLLSVTSYRDTSTRFSAAPSCMLATTMVLVGVLVGMLFLKPSMEHHQTANGTSVPGAPFLYFETHTLKDSEIIQMINLNRFGFKLYFLPNTSLEPVTFTIGVTVSQNFIPPSNTTLVSAIYYIKTSSKLLQPVIVEIEHCVNTDWINNTTLTFAKADTDSSPPYVFTKLMGGRFGGNSWGTIKLSKFSEVAVFDEGEDSSIDYLGHLLSSRRKGGLGIYNVVLVVSRSLNADEEVVKNRYRYSEWVPIMNTPTPFEFNNGSTALTLTIDKKGIQSGNWKIEPMSLPPKVKRSAVERYGLASYELMVSWTTTEEAVPLRYFMDIHGTSWESFMIFIDPREVGKLSTHSGDRTQGELLGYTEIEDFNQLYQAVAEISEWNGLCSNLGVNEAKMNVLRASGEKIEDKKRECLQAYFDTGEAYWEEVVRAIIKHPVNKKRVADKIVKSQELRSEL